MCKGCDGWKERGLDKRDFRHSKDGPEEIPHRSKKSKKWCKGKEGREHEYEQVLWHSYKYRDSLGKERVRNTYRWICKGCGKVSWGTPLPSVGKHDHHFCETEIVERSWRNYDTIMEVCCLCKKTGRSYKFYK